MKKVTKRHSKKGFTLLEVLLATVIMSIVSLMIMQGFLATMNFAHNNNIYSRSGSANYAKCVAFISQNVNMSYQARIFGHSGSTTGKTVFKPAAGSFTGGNTFTIRAIDHEEDSVVTPHENVAGKITTEFNETGVVNYHRHAFFYQPILSRCPADTEAVPTHPVRYCYVPKTGTYGWYCIHDGCPYSLAANPIPVPSI